ncbi:hypothetical protein GCM10010343_13940 [Streptomyces avidinii]|nr:hypothetical protein GCM10010343_13940 [Streptomyces avidinii]
MHGRAGTSQRFLRRASVGTPPIPAADGEARCCPAWLTAAWTVGIREDAQ